MAGTIPANGAENLTPGMEEMEWAVLGTASLRPHPSLQLLSPPKTNELEEAFPLLKAHTREVALHSRGQELKSEEERKTDRKIHLPLENPQSGGHLEVIFHCAESCFWPFSRQFSSQTSQFGTGEALSLHPHGFGKRNIILGARPSSKAKIWALLQGGAHGT